VINKNSQKSRGKSRAASHPPHSGRNGGLLQTGGTNPGAGRPSNEFRDRCREATDRIHAIDIASSIAQDSRKAARDRLAALTWLADRAYGKPAQPVDGQYAEPTEGKFIVEYVDAQCPKCGSHDQEMV